MDYLHTIRLLIIGGMAIKVHTHKKRNNRTNDLKFKNQKTMNEWRKSKKNVSTIPKYNSYPTEFSFSSESYILSPCKQSNNIKRRTKKNEQQIHFELEGSALSVFIVHIYLFIYIFLFFCTMCDFALGFRWMKNQKPTRKITRTPNMINTTIFMVPRCNRVVQCCVHIFYMHRAIL